MKRGVLVGLLSQIKCMSLWAPVETDLKFYYDTTSEKSFWSVCLRSGSKEQFFKKLNMPSSSENTDRRVFSFRYVSEEESEASFLYR
jgi:hypothetical protein